MKHLFITALGLLWSTLLSAQLYVEGTLLTPSNTGAYMEIRPLRNSDKSFLISVDYGQRRSQRPFDCLTDDKGRRYEFHSAVDALNFLYDNGWEVIAVYTVQEMRRYLLRRR